MSRPLYSIAADIYANIREGQWKAPGRVHAMPYLEAMATLDTINDRYGCDSGKSVVLYFLANASTWRGGDAGRIKEELKEIIKSAK